MSDYTPVNDDVANGWTASVTVVGGRLVSISGSNTVAPSAVGDTPIGVAAFDAAVGTRVTVFELDSLHETTSTAGVTAGQQLVAGAGGTVETAGGTPAAGTVVGIAVTTAAALGKARWKHQ